MSAKYRILEKHIYNEPTYHLETTFLGVFWRELDWSTDLGIVKRMLARKLDKKQRPKILATYDRHGEVVNFDGELRIEQFQ